MLVVIVGALAGTAQIYGPYGAEDVAERARLALADQGEDGIVRPLTNGLLAYADMRDAAPDPFNDWTEVPRTDNPTPGGIT